MYLDAIHESTLRATLLEVLRTEVPGNAISRDSLIQRTVLRLAPALNHGADAESITQQLKKAYVSFANTTEAQGGVSNSGEQADVLRLEASIWDLVNRGIVYPRFGEAEHGDIPWTIKWLVVTPFGARWAQQAPRHPSSPDFVATAIRETTLPPEVKTLLEEAHACFQHRLLRSAVILLGLAYEAIAGEVFDFLIRDKRPEAKRILEKLDAALKSTGNEAGVRAVRVADDIRSDRNQASHFWALNYDDVGRVETLLILGFRNVGEFWALTGR